MSDGFILKLAEQAIFVILKASAPMLIVALVVGLLVSIFQATTQIQEQTLAFVPKIVAVLVVMVFCGPWILHTLTDFTADILGNLYKFIG